MKSHVFIYLSCLNIAYLYFIICSYQSSNPSCLETKTPAIISAFACGMLLYVSVIEMISEDIGSHILMNVKLGKPTYITGLILGCTSMSILAAYA